MAEANRNATAAVVSGHLQPGHEPIFRVVARRGQAAIASTNTMTVTMNGSDESGWYRVTGLTYKGVGEAGWDDRGQTLKIRPEFLAPKADPEDPDQSIWVEASDWKMAVWTVVQGQLNVEATFDAGWIRKGDIVTHNFPSGGDFVVGTEAEIRQIGLNSTRKASHFKDRPQNKVIAVEDAYAELDRDYDDWWWEVEVEKLDDVDLDIDSDRDNGLQPPDRSTREDDLEDAAGEVGKIVAVNDDDRDGDGIPDFADGFGRFADQPESSQPPTAARGGGFVPIVIEVPDALDLALATFRFDYDASDPNGVSRTGSDTPADPYHYTPAPGKLRLWTKDGTAQRDARSIHEGGDYIAPLFGQDTYTPDDWARIGITSSNRTNTLWVEGIGVSQSKGDLPVEFRVDPNGDVFGTSLTLTDRVKITAIDVDVLIGADNASDESLKDDWVGASDGQRQHTIYNWLRFRGPAQLEQQFTVDSVSLGGGTITLQGYNPDGSLRPPGPITATLETGGNGQDTGEFLIRGGNVSTTPDDVAVRASFKGQVFGSQSVTVLGLSDVEEVGTLPRPLDTMVEGNYVVNPAVRRSPLHVIAFDVGMDSVSQPALRHNGGMIGGTKPQINDTTASQTPVSRKFGAQDIEVTFARRIEGGSAGSVLERLSTDGTVTSAALSVAPAGVNGSRHASNLRFLDSATTGTGVVGNTYVYYLGHPTEKLSQIDGIEDNYARRIEIPTKQDLSYILNVTLLQYTPPGGVLQTTGLTLADVTRLVTEASRLWEQVGVRFTPGIVMATTATAATQWDLPDDSPAYLTAVTTIARANGLDVFVVNTINTADGAGWLRGAAAYENASRIGNRQTGVVLASREGSPTSSRSELSAMARTLAHEIGHLIFNSDSHDTRLCLKTEF